MSRTAVNVTTATRLDWKHSTAARPPVRSVATQGVRSDGCTCAMALLIGPGQARSRPDDQTIRANWRVIASDALKIAMIAPYVMMLTNVSPKAALATSVSGVGEARNLERSGAPKT